MNPFSATKTGSFQDLRIGLDEQEFVSLGNALCSIEVSPSSLDSRIDLHAIRVALDADSLKLFSSVVLQLGKRV